MNENEINFYLAEYSKLKDEQQKRIGYRDHMIYLTLVLIGAVFSFSLENQSLDRIGFLVLPFITLLLGWTYIANDFKISSIKDYIVEQLIPQIGTKHLVASNWELYSKKLTGRKQRKIIQLIVDSTIFCGSGFIAIISFFLLNTSFDLWHLFLAIIESILLIFLFVFFVNYSK